MNDDLGKEEEEEVARGLTVGICSTLTNIVSSETHRRQCSSDYSQEGVAES